MSESMWETCPVELRVSLPRPVAAEVEEVQRRDPELLSRMLFYAMTRRTIFDQLSARAGVVDGVAELDGGGGGGVG
jgi:uncharacterized protein (DUF2252 family)